MIKYKEPITIWVASIKNSPNWAISGAKDPLPFALEISYSWLVPKGSDSMGHRKKTFNGDYWGVQNETK